MRRALLLAIAVVVLAACGQSDSKALQGYVEGEYVRVAAPFAGTLVSLETARGKQVDVGGALFVLESENEGAAKKEAEENFRRAEAQAENLRKGPRVTEIATQRAQLTQAEVTAEFSEKEWKRQLDLVQKGFVSQSAADAARTTRDRDRDKVTELKNTLATLEAGNRPDEIRAAEAEAAAAKQSLAQADWKLRQKSVASTVAGTVIDTLFVRGEWVPAGAPVVSLLPPTNVKARFFVPEERLGAREDRPKREARVRRMRRADRGAGHLHRAAGRIHAARDLQPRHRAKLVFLVEARPSRRRCA